MSGDMRSLSIECQFLLTLTILRRNYDYLGKDHLLSFRCVGLMTFGSIFQIFQLEKETNFNKESLPHIVFIQKIKPCSFVTVLLSVPFNQ